MSVAALDAYQTSVRDGLALYDAALDATASSPALDALTGHRVAIVGCSGLVGSALGEVLSRAVRRLSTGAPRVVGVSRRPGHWPAELPFVAADVTEPGSLAPLADVEYCIYLAGPSGMFLEAPASMVQVQLNGLISALAERCGTKRFVFVSSVRVYGRRAVGVVTEDQPVAIDLGGTDHLYDSAKRWAEGYCEWARTRRG